VKEMSRTIVIEFLGLPKAGKSKHIEFIKRRLEAAGVKTVHIPDKIKEAPFDDEITKNDWAINSVATQIVVLRNAGKDIVFVDRGALAYLASIATIIIRIAEAANQRIEEEKIDLKLFRIRDEQNQLTDIEKLVQSMKKSALFDKETLHIIEQAESVLLTAKNTISKEDYYFYIQVSPQTSILRDRELEDRTTSRIISEKHLLLMKNVYQCIERNRMPKLKKFVLNGEEKFQINQDIIFNKIMSLVNSKKDSSPRSTETEVAGKEEIRNELR
jgi:hypothetical protein